jgi:hypothetical protein
MSEYPTPSPESQCEMTLPNFLRLWEHQYRELDEERNALQKQKAVLDIRVRDLNQMCDAVMAAISSAKKHLPQDKGMPVPPHDYVPGHVL